MNFEGFLAELLETKVPTGSLVIVKQFLSLIITLPLNSTARKHEEGVFKATFQAIGEHTNPAWSPLRDLFDQKDWSLLKTAYRIDAPETQPALKTPQKRLESQRQDDLDNPTSLKFPSPSSKRMKGDHAVETASSAPINQDCDVIDDEFQNEVPLKIEETGT